MFLFVGDGKNSERERQFDVPLRKIELPEAKGENTGFVEEMDPIASYLFHFFGKLFLFFGFFWGIGGMFVSPTFPGKHLINPARCHWWDWIHLNKYQSLAYSV